MRIARPPRLPGFRSGGLAPIVVILAVLLVLLSARQPDFFSPPSLMSFLGRSAPIVLLAAGQYFVIVSGELDLSVGSLVTAQVVVAYRWLPTDDMLVWSLALFAAAAVLMMALNARMHGNIAYVLAALWGLVAVYVKQSGWDLYGARLAAWTALAIAAALLAQTVWLRVRAARHRHLFAD